MRVSGRYAAAVLTAALLAVAGCDGLMPMRGGAVPDRFTRCAASPNDCNTGARRSGGTFTVALAEEPRSFNVDAPDGAVGEAYTVMNSLLPAAFLTAPDGSTVLNADLLQSAQLTRTGPQTVVYRIAPGAVWDDGTAISATDFTYAWQTQNGRDCPGCRVASTAGYDQIGAVTGTDAGRTVTVTFTSPYPDWRGLFNALYPAHVEGAGIDLSTKDGLAAAFARQAQLQSWTGGPYKVTGYSPGSGITLAPNPRWYGKDKPTLEAVRYKFIADQASMVSALQAKQINAFSAVPTQDLIDVLHGLIGSGVRYEVTNGAAWQRIDLNTGVLTDITLRSALFTAIDVKQIIDQTVRGYFPAVQRLGSHNLMVGAPGYQDVRSAVAPEQGSGNIALARKTLTDGGYTFVGGRLTKGELPVPAMRLVYTDSVAQSRAAVLIQRAAAAIGVPVSLVPTADLAAALESRGYEIALYAWPTSPSLTASREEWASDGGNNFTGWADADSDALLRQVTRELDPQKAYTELNLQDQILTRSAVVLPLYRRPLLLAVAGDYVNVRGNPVGYLSYNAQQWGLAA